MFRSSKAKAIWKRTYIFLGKSKTPTRKENNANNFYAPFCSSIRFSAILLDYKKAKSSGSLGRLGS